MMSAITTRSRARAAQAAEATDRRGRHVKWATHALPAALLGASLILPAVALADDGHSGSGDSGRGDRVSDGDRDDRFQPTAMATPQPTVTPGPTTTPAPTATPRIEIREAEIRPKVVMCHVTGSTMNPFVVTIVDDHAVEAHRAQGDFIAPNGVLTDVDCARVATLVAGVKAAAPPVEMEREGEVELEAEATRDDDPMAAAHEARDAREARDVREADAEHELEDER